jgi:peroxiredoxin
MTTTRPKTDKDFYSEDDSDDSRKNRIKVFAIIGAVLVIIFYILLNPNSVVSPFYDEVENPAPKFTVKDIDGNTVKLSDYRGKVVVLDLMATWCGPCIVEMGHLKDVYNNYSSSEVVIMSIDIDQTESNDVIRKFKEDYGDDWIFASDIDGVEEKYHVQFIPTMVVIDKDGGISYQNVGITTSEKLSEEIDKLL